MIYPLRDYARAWYRGAEMAAMFVAGNKVWEKVKTFSPLTLFANGEQGAWFDPSDLGSMFQDAAGTIPAAYWQPVGLILDKSGNGNHASQATATARPTLMQDGEGRAYLHFDGVDDRLLTNAVSGMGAPFYAVTGVQTLNLSGTASYPTVFGAYTSGTDRADIAARLSAGVGNVAAYVRVAGGVQTALNRQIFVDLLPHVVSAAFAGGQVILRGDGLELGRAARDNTHGVSPMPIVIGQGANGASEIFFFGGAYVLGYPEDPGIVEDYYMRISGVMT